MTISERIMPEPALDIKPEHQDIYIRLKEGIHSRQDPVTWRTLGIELKTLLGLDDPERQHVPEDQFDQARTLVETLTLDSYYHPLIPEILYALGLNKELIIAELDPQPLDALIISGRHMAEPLTFALADQLAAQGQSVAFFEPIGHYNDQQSRTIGPLLLLRPVENLVILSSTQVQHGGRIEILKKAIRFLNNEQFTSQVKSVTVAIPMFGSSRSHRPGQAEEMGYEIFDADHNPEEIASTAQRTIDYLSQKSVPIPQFCFLSIDIHNLEMPQEAFAKQGFEFTSLSPAPEFAHATYQELEQRQLLDLPLKVISPDEGANPRTEDIATKLLQHPHNHLKSLEVIFVKKTRKNGQVDKVSIDRVEQWTLQPDGNIKKDPVPSPSLESPSQESCIIIGNDDILDTCGTAGEGTEFIRAHYPHSRFSIFIATHPVLSRGPENLNKIKADLILTGNTLDTSQAENNPKINPQVRIVNLAPTLARAISQT